MPSCIFEIACDGITYETTYDLCDDIPGGRGQVVPLEYTYVNQ